MYKRAVNNYATFKTSTEKVEKSKIICTDCNLILTTYCDNNCNTAFCSKCGNAYHINTEKDILLVGHNPLCLTSNEPAFDQFSRWLPKCRSAPIIDKKTGCPISDTK